MKKLFVPFLAVGIAVGLSAFTAPRSNPQGEPSTTLNYWRINSNGTLGTFLGTFSTHDAARQASGCQELIMTDCARGYVSSTPPSDPSQNVQDRIRRTN